MSFFHRCFSHILLVKTIQLVYHKWSILNGKFHFLCSTVNAILPNIVPIISRSSHRRCSLKFTAKHLCQDLFFNKVASLRPATLLKKGTLAHVFLCEFCKIFKNTFFLQNTFGRLFLYIYPLF